MSINDRIKAIRNALGLTQIDFGQKVGISQGHLTSIENGKRNVTDKSIKVICAMYNVNEDWLVNGVGDMFKPVETEVIAKVVDEYNLDSMDKKIIECYVQLPDEQRASIKNYLRTLVDALLDDTDAYAEYREEYMREHPATMAARNGDTSGLAEIVDLYENREE